MPTDKYQIRLLRIAEEDFTEIISYLDEFYIVQEILKHFSDFFVRHKSNNRYNICKLCHTLIINNIFYSFINNIVLH